MIKFAARTQTRVSTEELLFNIFNINFDSRLLYDESNFVTTPRVNNLTLLKNATTAAENSRFLELFYYETSHLVFRFCRKKGLSEETSEDIVQIVYTQIFKKRHRYNPDYHPLAWLFIITKSETKDYLKSDKIYKNYISDFSNFMSQNNTEEPSSLQEVDLSRLSESEKKIIQLRYTEDKDFEEIAQDLNLSPANIRKIISRGLQKLRKGAV